MNRIQASASNRIRLGQNATSRNRPTIDACLPSISRPEGLPDSPARTPSAGPGRTQGYRHHPVGSGPRLSRPFGNPRAGPAGFAQGTKLSYGIGSGPYSAANHSLFFAPIPSCRGSAPPAHGVPTPSRRAVAPRQARALGAGTGMTANVPECPVLSAPSPDEPAEPASPEADLSDRSLLRRWRNHEQDAATELYLRYAQRLRVLVLTHRSANLSRRVEIEDLLQSIFASFFRGAKLGYYDVPAGEELWKLVLVIALNKLRAQGNFHTAAKRDVRLTAGG